MNVADIRDAVKAVVEAHATWSNFYSIWSPAKDRDSELTYPAAVWGPWRARMVEDESGAIRRQVQCTLLVVDAVSTERTTAQRDATAEAAEEAASDFILKLRQDYGRHLELSNVQVSTVHDEGTVLETGVILSFTANVDEVVCLDGDEFNPPSNCPTFEELVADLTWTEIKADLSPEQIAAAEADLCDGGGGTVTITGTDGLTELPPVDCGDTYALPVTHIFFEDNVGQPSGVLLGLGTVVEETDGHLYPDIVVPSRFVKNTAGDNANTFRATLEDLVNDTLPIAQDGFWSLKDTDGNELKTGSIPSNASADITAPDATVTRDGLPFSTVLSGGTIDVPSAPCDPELSLRLNGGRVHTTLDLDCGLQEFDILVTTEGGTPIGTYDNVEARIEVTPGQVQLQDTAANPIGSPVSIEPESGGNTITAPDGSVTIRNSVPTTLHTVAVRSNGSTTQAISDSTITRPDGTTVGLPATVALDVRDYRSGIAYNFGRILHSGQTTVYQAGDEGTMYAGGFFTYVRPLYPTHYAELGANFTTLAANNIYGNTLRFTDRTGAAAASSGNRFIQDHLTGIEYYVLNTYLTAPSWNAAVTAGVNINTTLGETGWYLLCEKVLDTITNDDSAAFISGAPFSAPTSNNLWTSSTVPGGTTGAKFLGLQFGQLGSIAKTTAGQLYGIFCRRFI